MSPNTRPINLRNCKTPEASIASLLSAAVARLSDSDSPVLDAEVLLSRVTGRSRAGLMASHEAVVSPARVEEFERLVARRAAGEPVAYLTGRREFWSLDLEITPDVLIPRPETELLVELVLALSGSLTVDRVLDLGTGSGAVALAVATELKQCQVVATDRSPAALETARRNARRLGLGAVQFVNSNWFDGLVGERFDVIVSNPPYIAVGDAHLARGDVAHEPAAALASGNDGLDDLRRIIADAPQHLVDGGAIVLEHGFEQGPSVRQLLSDAGFTDAVTIRDLAGQERATRANRATASG